MPRLSNDSDLDAIGHEVYGEPAPAEAREINRRARSVGRLLARLRRREFQRTRPAPLLDRIDEDIE